MYVFTSMHADLTNQGAIVAFDPKWMNNTGYMDFAVDAPLGLNIGEQRAFVDIHGRRGILTTTMFGNVVVFERYKARPENKQLVIVGNSPRQLDAFLGPVTSSSYNEDAVALLLGGMGTPNIGERLRKLYTKMLDAA